MNILETTKEYSDDIIEMMERIVPALSDKDVKYAMECLMAAKSRINTIETFIIGVRELLKNV